MNFILRSITTAFLFMTLSGCSVREFVLGSVFNSAGDSISAIYLSENDPDLVRESLPTNMKLIELLIQQSPGNPALLTSACQVFTVYAYAFILRDAEIVMDENFSESRRLAKRGKKLLLRARDYGMEAFEAKYPGFGKSYASDPKSALTKVSNEDLSLLYWTAASWGLLISSSKDNPAAIVELPNMGHFLERGLELDESYDRGSFHDLMFTYTLSRPDGGSSAPEIAIKHYNRAMKLSEGSRASLYISYAESISVSNQNKEEFLELLDKALAVDVDEIPGQRLSNILAQERAQWLRERVDELFF
jgi:predicted anti-sigma-YlaC factor YlaD